MRRAVWQTLAGLAVCLLAVAAAAGALASGTVLGPGVLGGFAAGTVLHGVYVVRLYRAHRELVAAEQRQREAAEKFAAEAEWLREYREDPRLRYAERLAYYMWPTYTTTAGEACRRAEVLHELAGLIPAAEEFLAREGKQ